ncbi:carbon-nitrogen hydrolase family protein [bacterium]|nr:carbon-nitrogen hydrolase family protein [bacterium]
MKRFAFLIIILCVFVSMTGCDDDMFVGVFYSLGSPLKYDDSEATRRLKVAACCLESSIDPDSSFSRMVGMISGVKTDHPDVRLIVFGETVLGWYYKPDEPEAYQRRIAQTIPGPATDSVAELCKTYDIYVVFGLAELRGGYLYNSQVLINPQGSIQAVHSKHDLIYWDQLSGYTQGMDTTIVQIDDIKAGMIVCADINSLWATRSIGSQNVDVVIHSLANVGDLNLEIDPNSRRFDAWEIFANRYGWEGAGEERYLYGGETYIADPVGCVRERSRGEQGYVFCDLGVH